jgi:hypothetical protein
MVKRIFEAELDHRLSPQRKHHERTPQSGIKLEKNISTGSQEIAGRLRKYLQYSWPLVATQSHINPLIKI